MSAPRPSLPVLLPLLDRRPWLVVLTLVLAAVAVYANSFGGALVFDDLAAIRDNPTLRSLWGAWFPPAGGLTVSGRPFLNFTFALDRAAGGGALWSYHLGNLAIHAAAGAVLFAVVRRTLRRPRLAGRFGGEATCLAGLTALLWLVHPLQTESVTYLVQRAESLVSLCYLITFWCFLRAAEPGAHRAWAVSAVAVCVLGMMTKEVMVSAPFLVLLYDRMFMADSWREVWSRRGRMHLALAATWLVLGGLVWATAGRGGTAGFGTDIGVMAYARMQFAAILHYLRLVVWPHPLVLDYGRPVVESWRAVWWQAPLLLGVLGASLLAAARARPLGFVGVCFFAILAPSSSFVPVVTQTIAEHRMYLALAPVLLLAVLATYAWCGRRSWIGWLAVALVWGGLTIQRNTDYRSETRIWEDVVAKYPANPRALGTLGSLYEKEVRLEEAERLLREAVTLDPLASDVWNNLGNVHLKQGQVAPAIDCFRHAQALKPAEPTILNNLGNALLQLGRADEAVVHLEAALRQQPEWHAVRFNLANTLVQCGRPRDALPHYEACVRAQPDDAEIHANYGSVLLRLGRVGEGLVQLEAALRLAPGSPEIHNNLGIALAQQGRLRDALEHFEVALRLKPDDEHARINLDRVKRALGGG